MEFKTINAIVCPNVECEQIIPEDWKACYENEFCPKCGCGYDEQKIELWRQVNSDK